MAYPEMAGLLKMDSFACFVQLLVDLILIVFLRLQIAWHMNHFEVTGSKLAPLRDAVCRFVIDCSEFVPL